MDSPTVDARSAPPGGRGWWLPGSSSLQKGDAALASALVRIDRPFFVVRDAAGLGIATSGEARLGDTDNTPPADNALPLAAYVPAVSIDALGDSAFCAEHNVRYAYVAGAMANGITSEAMVESMANAGMLCFFGAAGLDLPRVEAAIDRLKKLGDRPYGFNLIHSPAEPELEAKVVELYLARGIHLVSASAYLDLTLPLLRYRLNGIHRAADGKIVTPNRVCAKVSRVEVARKFFAPAPAPMLERLVAEGTLTREQAELAAQVPVAEDLTAEADSGGHTDNRPFIALLPTMLALRDEMQARYEYQCTLRVGAAGGIATPQAAAAAFSMGAAYVLTGSINQSCREAGTSPAVREMLAKASQADVAMAPAADMFEMGVQVQVLKWGTLFAARARKLYEVYTAHSQWESVPEKLRQSLERDYFKAPFDGVWASTRDFFAMRDPKQIERGERDPHHKMALVFRSYLGQSSHWANAGEPSRRADYQIWCGPSMGAFNEWVKGSYLEPVENRDVATAAMNILVGAAVCTRAGSLRAQGVRVPPLAERFTPQPGEELAELLRN